jgi:hypothetical protein
MGDLAAACLSSSEAQAFHSEAGCREAWEWRVVANIGLDPCEHEASVGGAVGLYSAADSFLRFVCSVDLLDGDQYSR